jgi:hypothetical protein
MRNQDLDSKGYLAITAAGFAALCSILLAFAFFGTVRFLLIMSVI